MNQIRFSKLLYVALLLVLVACAPAAPLAPTAVPPTAAPTAVPPTAAPTAVPPTAVPTVASAQALTTFTSKTFELPVTLSYGSGWSVTEYPDQVYLKNNHRADGWQLAFDLVAGAKIADPNSDATIPWPQDLVAYLRSNPNIEAGEPKPITFGGFKGIQIDAHAKYTGDKRLFIQLAGSAEGWLYLDMEEMWRFIVLDDVNGERLVITMTVNPPLDELAMFADAAQKVLDTVVFTKPSATVPSAYPLLVEHPLPTPASEPGGIVAGPDGALWFVETAVNKIGRITADGVVTEYPVPTAGAIDPDQGFLAVGPDGALWFNEDLVNQIGRITTSGQVTEFKLPDALKPTQDDAPIRAIVTGPDGALWVTSPGANAIVKLTMDGQIATKYTLPKAGSNPVGMVVGPDGALWFVEDGVNQIGRVTLDGKLTEYALPENSKALRITVGPDKAMWFTMYTANKIGRISTDGALTVFDAPGMGPVGITTGADGALWFTGYASTEIGRMTTDGVLTKMQVPTTASVSYHITAGPDGNLWFTEQQGNKIGEIQLSAP